MSGMMQRHNGAMSRHRLPAAPPDSLPNVKFNDVVFACCIGSFIQYYDFFILYYFLDEIQNAFFPDHYSDSAIYWFIFYIPYAVRTIAALPFGYLSDRSGRRSCLILCTFVVGVPTVLLGLTPKYDDVGYWSVAMVIFLRCLQAIGVAGEYTNAVLYLYEQTGNESNHAFAQSLMWMGSTGSILGVLWKLFLPHDSSRQHWTFRLPFLCSFFLMFVVYIVRIRLPVDKIVDRIQNPLRYVLNNMETYGTTILIVTFSILFPVIGHTASFFWLPIYLRNKHDPRDNFVYYGLIISMVLALSIMLAVGRFADLYDQLYKRVRVSVLITLTAMISVPLILVGMADTSNDVGMSIQQSLFCIICLACVPSTMAWCVGYVEDQNIRGTILTFAFNVAETFTGALLSNLLNQAFKRNMNQIWSSAISGLLIGIFAAISAFSLLLGTKYHYKSIDVPYDQISTTSDDETDPKSLVDSGSDRERPVAEHGTEAGV